MEKIRLLFKTKKAQGALEFLMTYGWQNNLGQAIYILASNATNSTSPEGFGGCVMSVLDNTGAAIGLDEEGANEAAGTVSPVSDGAYFTVQASGCEDLGGLVAGSKYKIAVDVAYYAATSSSAFSHSVNGELFANVEEG